MNNFQLSGYLPFDLELKESAGGVKYTRGCINVQHQTKNGTTHFSFRFVAFGKVAEAMTAWLGKNRKVLLEGHHEENRYTDPKTGEKRSSVEFFVERWEFAGDMRDKKEPAKKETPPDDGLDDITDDRIPF